jgi:hypothetical protein
MLLLCLVWLTRSTVISPDGYDWLKHSLKEGTWINYLREPLGMLIFRITVFFGNTLLIGTLHQYFPADLFMWNDNHLAALACAQVFSTSGFHSSPVHPCAEQHRIYIDFLGNIEIYALLHLFFVLFCGLLSGIFRTSAEHGYLG